MTTRGVAAFLAGVTAGLTAWAWMPAPRFAAAAPAATAHASRATVGYGQIRYDGHGPEAWHAIATRLQRELDQAHADLRRRFATTALDAIALASITEHVDQAALIRTIRCETGGTFDPFAKNPGSSARGLGQFLTTGTAHRYGDRKLVDGGTWATTPFWRFDVYDPYANAAAVAWMHAHGRGSEFCA